MKENDINDELLSEKLKSLKEVILKTIFRMHILSI